MLAVHCPAHSFTAANIFRGHAYAGQSEKRIWDRVARCGGFHARVEHRGCSTQTTTTTATFKPLPFT